MGQSISNQGLPGWFNTLGAHVATAFISGISMLAAMWFTVGDEAVNRREVLEIVDQRVPFATISNNEKRLDKLEEELKVLLVNDAITQTKLDDIRELLLDSQTES